MSIPPIPKKIRFITLVSLAILSVILLAQQTIEKTFLVDPYLQFSTQKSITILWETRELCSTIVSYGEARANVSQAILDQSISREGTRSMHEVLLDNLKPETNYFWKAISVTTSGDTIQSELLSFKTAVHDSSAYTFALVGDTQRNPITPWAWKKISDLIWKDRPHFVVHAGDVVDQGLDKSDWIDNFFPNGRPLISRVPFYTVLGNHEQDAPYYYQYMVAPQPEYYYTFTYGNAQFFMIDTNRDVHEGSEQYNWLEWELARSTATWKIAMHHHPPYSSDSDDHGNTSFSLSTLGTKARNLVPLYEKYGLDFCLFGHTHLYERTWPIKDNQIDMKNGVVYINSGGAGGKVEDFAPTRSWFTMELEAIHHYCTFSVFQNHVVFKSIDHEGRLIDTFQMQKELKDNITQANILQPPAPHLETPATLFDDETKIVMTTAFPDLEIRFTTDGTEPTKQSKLYTQPLLLKKTTPIAARAYTQDGRASRVINQTFTKAEPLPPVKADHIQKGLKVSYYEGSWRKIPDFSKLRPIRTEVLNNVSLNGLSHREDEFAVVLEGYVQIKNEGIQHFFVNSDDGSKLYIDDVLLIDHDELHSAIKKTAQAMLAPGLHKIRVEYFEATGSELLQAGIIDDQLGAVPFAPFHLFH